MDEPKTSAVGFDEDALSAANAAFNAEAQEPLMNPAVRVYFRAGLIACREYMARFVEQGGDATTAGSIRANWWPSLGEDFGPPRQLDFGELTEGEYGEPGFRCKGPDEVSPNLEAVAIAWAFLVDPAKAVAKVREFPAPATTT